MVPGNTFKYAMDPSLINTAVATDAAAAIVDDTFWWMGKISKW